MEVTRAGKNDGMSYGRDWMRQLIIITVVMCILSGLEGAEVEVEEEDFSNFLFLTSLIIIKWKERICDKREGMYNEREGM